MLRKAFQVQVELEIQAVSCPGVWLCPNGKVSLQLYMLGSCIQTTSAEPLFPILFQEKFIFFKTFFSVQKLVGLQKVLNKELLYAELIQWQDCEIGNVLATFQTTLGDLLFPGKRCGTMAGVDVDLLMEPMKNFPGILAPKIEVSTKTVIEDKVCVEEDCDSYVINPKVLSSKATENLSPTLRQKSVCHSVRYHKAKKCGRSCRENVNERPPFVFRHLDENLINRKYDDGEYCSCKKLLPRRGTNEEVKDYFELKSLERGSQKSTECVRIVRKHDDSEMHTQDNCPICSKYKYYFESKTPTLKSKKVSPRTTRCNCADLDLIKADKLCNYPPRGDSLADKIHDRLTNTFNRFAIESPCMDDCSARMWDCRNSDDNCTASSFKDFYRRLYEKTKDKCEKYISCN